MAQMTGYVCDICGQFTISKDKWLKVTSYTDNRTTDTGWDICSNKCLAKLGRDRIKENAGTTGIAFENRSKAQRERRFHSDDFKQQIVKQVLNGRRTQEVATEFNLSRSLVDNWVRSRNPLND